MWYSPSKPKDIQTKPWLHDTVITYLESILEPHWNIIEHGSGGSTLWFSERVNTIMAYEHDLKWLRKIEDLSIDNVFICDDNYPVSYSNYYDLLLIDGEPVETRIKWIMESPQIVRKNGWIVLDNANRPEYANARSWLNKQVELVKRFDCNENTKYMVTEFYQCRV